MENKTTATVSVGALATLMTSLYGGLEWADTRYANAGDVKAIELRLEQKILTDQLRDIEVRLWTLQERYGKELEKPEHATLRAEYQRLQQQQHDIEEQLQDIREQTMKQRYEKK